MRLNGIFLWILILNLLALGFHPIAIGPDLNSDSVLVYDGSDQLLEYIVNRAGAGDVTSCIYSPDHSLKKVITFDQNRIPVSFVGYDPAGNVYFSHTSISEPSGLVYRTIIPTFNQASPFDTSYSHYSRHVDKGEFFLLDSIQKDGEWTRYTHQFENTSYGSLKVSKYHVDTCLGYIEIDASSILVREFSENESESNTVDYYYDEAGRLTRKEYLNVYAQTQESHFEKFFYKDAQSPVAFTLRPVRKSVLPDYQFDLLGRKFTTGMSSRITIKGQGTLVKRQISLK